MYSVCVHSYLLFQVVVNGGVHRQKGRGPSLRRGESLSVLGIPPVVVSASVFLLGLFEGHCALWASNVPFVVWSKT